MAASSCLEMGDMRNGECFLVEQESSFPNMFLSQHSDFMYVDYVDCVDVIFVLPEGILKNCSDGTAGENQIKHSIA